MQAKAIQIKQNQANASGGKQIQASKCKQNQANASRTKQIKASTCKQKQAKSSKCKQMQAEANKYKQANASKSKENQENTSKCKQMQAKAHKRILIKFRNHGKSLKSISNHDFSLEIVPEPASPGLLNLPRVRFNNPGRLADLENH